MQIQRIVSAVYHLVFGEVCVQAPASTAIAQGFAVAQAQVIQSLAVHVLHSRCVCAPQ